ncbi:MULTISPECIES: alpha/beta hydrolase [unclassified Spirosoma]|mgnify:CR=1 FL=1|uniref:alpha/beta fold hydrolase n=1 Tax=unclassified Spirosoma TaxID=2621999 RepID=UPI000960EAD8|nr:MULTISPECIES: alpha/beta hydrolase [unclassified Spirosoma]MBN8824073.1 alpha/beta hydrolase [Spirosoma sp.]OJW70471.1 MAG: alpha/beta hydrolase [Spirosoma sp. 48-14]
MSKARVQKIEVAGNLLAYQTIGNGPVVLLAFHGFGQNSHVFKGLEVTLGNQYTIFALDLFFHGESCYRKRELLTKTAWQQLIGAFLQEKNIDRFALMGFSLGGRFALATVEAFADRLDQLVLIAPDGITRSAWYQLATASKPGRWLFRYFLQHLTALNRLGHLLTRLSLLNRTAMRFAELSLGTPEQRERVYQSWTQFRLISPDLAHIAALLNNHAVRVRFFTGAFDRIVPGSYILPLSKQLRHYDLTVLRTGHNRLVELTAEQLRQ